MTIAEIIAQAFADIEADGETYNTKDVIDLAYERAQDVDLDDDPLYKSIRSGVTRSDKDRRETAQPQLTLSGFDVGFGKSLALGNGDRRPIETAKHEHVIEDEAISAKNARLVHDAQRNKEERNRALHRYLALGLTVPEAVAAYEADRS